MLRTCGEPTASTTAGPSTSTTSAVTSVTVGVPGEASHQTLPAEQMHAGYNDGTGQVDASALELQRIVAEIVGQRLREIILVDLLLWQGGHLAVRVVKVKRKEPLDGVPGAVDGLWNPVAVELTQR